MQWLNNGHRCRDRERKRTQSNDASGALQHMAHQSRVKPPHKLHALYIAICINKLLVFCGATTNAWAKETTPLTKKLLFFIIIVIAHSFHAHWPSPFHNQILLQTDVLTHPSFFHLPYFLFMQVQPDPSDP